ncbi:hypothetical protein MKX03_002248, partial [Papaver bracteatum]
MLAILRRKIASEGSNASSTIGQSLHRLRPSASSATRSYTAASNETLLLRRGSKYVQNFSCQILPGTTVTSKSMRELGCLLRKDSKLQGWTRSFSSDN